MKKILLLHVLLIFACSKNTEIKNPRIAIIGLGIESSTFSPATTSKEAFHAKRGIEIFDEYPFGVFNPVPTAVPPMGSSLK